MTLSKSPPPLLSQTLFVFFNFIRLREKQRGATTTMDRLVKADVKEVEIAFKRGQKCTKTFRLTNLMHTMAVAVSLTTTANQSLFSFDKPLSIIPPLSSSSYTLILSQPSDHPPLSTPHDAVVVKSSMLPLGKALHDDLSRVFAKPGPHIFRDATIPISFVGPDVVEFLISRHTKILATASFFNKAVSGCSASQLSASLQNAVVYSNEELVTSLIDNGADVNHKDSDGRSMISLAVQAGNVDVVDVLIASGSQIDDSIDRVLYYAAASGSVDLMRTLISAFPRVNVNSVDSYGRSPIHIAASEGHAHVIKFCASLAGVDTDVFDKNGSSPLHLAAENGHLDAVKCLLNCSNYNVKYAVNKDGKTAFAVAVDNGQAHLYDLLQLGDALQRAARVDDVHAMKSCLAEGARVNGRDQNGWTALHRAAFKGKIESVNILLSHGAEVDVVDVAGYTPLHCAVMAGHVEVALVLIARGAKANLKSLSLKRLVPLKLDCFKNHPSLCQEKEQV